MIITLIKFTLLILKTMNYKEQLTILQEQPKVKQIEFCEKVLGNIPIAIRCIFDDGLANEDALETIKWINEFNNSIHGLRYSTINLYPDMDIIAYIFDTSKVYATQSILVKGYLAFLLQSAFRQTMR